METVNCQIVLCSSILIRDRLTVELEAKHETHGAHATVDKTASPGRKVLPLCPIPMLSVHLSIVLTPGWVFMSNLLVLSIIIYLIRCLNESQIERSGFIWIHITFFHWSDEHFWRSHDLRTDTKILVYSSNSSLRATSNGMCLTVCSATYEYVELWWT